MSPAKPQAPMGKRERSKIEKRARILEVGGTLFRQQGYDETTTLQISRAARIATGTLFLYFSSKDELLIELFADRLRETVEAFSTEAIEERQPVRQMERFFLAMVTVHEEDPALTRHFIRAISIISDRRIAHNVIGLARSANLAIARHVIRMQRLGVVDRGFSPRTTAQVLFGTYFTSLVEWANGGIDDRQLHKRISAGVELVFDGLVPKK